MLDSDMDREKDTPELRSLEEARPLSRRELLIGGAAVLGLHACGGTSLNTPEGGACPAGVFIAEGPTAYTAGQPTYYPEPNAFIVRDANGLYALSAVCTHAGCAVSLLSGELFCPCHGSRFDLNGNVIRGPAESPLPHLALCLAPNGALGVDNTTVVDPSARVKE